MVGSSFGIGRIDVWDVSPTDGTLTLRRQIISNDKPAAGQSAPRPHQALLEPSGRFFAVNDLGTDTVLIIDSEADKFDIVNKIRVPDANAGCGPRHGAFFPNGAQKASHYFLLCELTRQILVFPVNYNSSVMDFGQPQVISATAPDFVAPGPGTPATGAEIILSGDNKSVFVSIRGTTNQTADSISRFTVNPLSGGNVRLEFAQSIGSGGKIPRMFNLSPDPAQSHLISTNQDGAFGLVAFARGGIDGALQETPVASLALNAFGEPTHGPQFAQGVLL